ncbi:MAG: hypothetical protein AAFX05_09890 [Planctomycetota bacterium]
MLFTGQYEHTIDSKNRLAIPADIRGRWDATRDGAAWFAVPWVGGVIRLYTEMEFQRRASSGELTLTPDEDEAELQATLFGLSRRLEMDASGRVRLPEEMLELVELEPEIVLIGAGERLEIRDRAQWQASKAERLRKLPELMRRISSKRQNGA